MFRNYRFSLLALVCILSACAHTNSGKTPDPAENDIKAVALVEDQWMARLVAKDTAALSAILAPDFILSGSSTSRETRAQYLITSAMAERTLEPIQLTDRLFQPYGHTIVSTGAAVYKGQWQNDSFNLPVRYTHVFVKMNGKWKVVAAHISSIQ